MKNHKFILSITLVVLGVVFRTIWHIGDNVEFVTTAALVAGAYLGLKYAVTVPLMVMMISDFLIGSTQIFIFTWSAYAIIGVMGYWGLSNQQSVISSQNSPLQNKIRKIIKATGFGIIASLWFYLWTNFGVWLLDSWGMYSKDGPGLLAAFIMGLPFLKLNLTGNLFFVPLTFAIMEIAPVMLNNLNVKTLKAVKLKI